MKTYKPANDNHAFITEREAMQRIIRMRAEQMRPRQEEPKPVVVTEERLRGLGVPEDLIEAMVRMTPWRESLDHLMEEYGL